MKRKGLRIALWIVAAPLILFIVLMALLYVPPVQNFLRGQATAMASQATGLDIRVERIDLRFPLNLLVRGVQVLQPADTTAGQVLPADTVLQLRSLSVKVQAWPLVHGRVEVDHITLEDADVRTGRLLPGMDVQGRLGRFFLQSHGIDLLKEELTLNAVELSDTRLTLTLSDSLSAEPEDTTASAPLKWKIKLHRLELEDIGLAMHMLSADTLHLQARVPRLHLEEAQADLGRQAYGWQTFGIERASLSYDEGAGTPAPGLDPAHLSVHNLNLALDSAYYCGHDIYARIRTLELDERSGLSVTSLDGILKADSSLVDIPRLSLRTGHSEIDLSAHTYWQLIDMPTTGHLSARLTARIGKPDVMLLAAGSLPDAFKEAYPSHPLVVRAGTDGNLREMQISRFSAELPGAFSLDGGGALLNLTDSLTRNGRLDLRMQTLDLGFLTALTGDKPDGSLAIPDSMRMEAAFRMDGSRYQAKLDVEERGGRLNLDAAYDAADDSYRANLQVDSMQLHHFLPKDSLYLLTAGLSARGKGFDFQSPRTVADVSLTVDTLLYGQWNLSGIGLKAGLHSSQAFARLTSDNVLLRMQADAALRLHRRHTDGEVDIRLDDAALHRFGLLDAPLAHPLGLRLRAAAARDLVRLQASAGDMSLDIRSLGSLEQLMQAGQVLTDSLSRQFDERRLSHASLRRIFPSARLHMQAGRRNPLTDVLAQQGMSFRGLKAEFGLSSAQGINGRMAVDGFRTDSLQLDTLFFGVRQDTVGIKFRGGVINGPHNPQIVFASLLSGEIRDNDAELTVSFRDKDGKTGVLLGLNMRPMAEADGSGNGVQVRLIPEEPVVAYRKFSFAQGKNRLFLHRSGRLYADVDMKSDEGIGFRLQSDSSDTTSLQNLGVELTRFRLSELSSVMPYLPQISGLFSAKAHYVQGEKWLRISADADVQKLAYEGNPVGDIGLSATWLPDEADSSHVLGAALMVDGNRVLTAGGRLGQGIRQDRLALKASIEKLPLALANAFVPDRMLTFDGCLNGELDISGSSSAPLLGGQLALADSASVFVRQLGARYWFDSRPLRIADNRLSFDNFSIYTTSRNPFSIHGTVDFADLARPMASLDLRAVNYTLLDVPRRRDSMVYGKVCVDVAASVRGPLDALTMRGNMNLLGSTDVTYVLTDSPLTVEDRLEGLVTFTSFADTTAVQTDSVPAMSLGGMDVIMTVHIDDAVRLRADLNADRSNYVELVGGGDLNLQYTPQGEMSLSGRYTLSGGVLKYSLPVIPLKSFSIAGGSYVDWRGDMLNPTLGLKATERMRASVADDDGASRMVNFDVSIAISGRLSAPELVFDIAAPEDVTIQNELQAMGAEERSKQAITMMATGFYLKSGAKGGNFDMGSALNSVLQQQINSLAGSALESANASFSIGVEDRTMAETGDKQTDYSFRYSQRFFNDRIQIVIGGKVSTGANATNDVESFIDNISLEYRLDQSGMRYVRVFHNKNYESVLDGEVTETGVGLVLRRKMNRLGELFIFRRPKQEEETLPGKDD